MLDSVQRSRIGRAGGKLDAVCTVYQQKRRGHTHVVVSGPAPALADVRITSEYLLGGARH